jgi:localization factor PodJL
MEVLRHDFIADAHRAKLKAASKPELPDLADMRAGELSVTPPEKKRRRSIFSLRSQRVAMIVLILLAAIPAAVFFMPRTPAVRSIPAAHTLVPMPEESATEPAAVAPVPAVPPSDPQAPAIENAPPQKSKATESHQPKAEGKFEDAASEPYSRMDTASLPDGIAVQANDVTGAQLSQQQQQARMAYLSGKLGDAAARATPAALMEEHALRANGAPAGSEQTESSIDGRLPPATVGPYSLRLAAAKGDAVAQFEVASRLAEGKGIDQDLKGAAQWYQRSAAQGFAMAQFRLGTLYERGLGITADQARALTWYQRAAEQGNVKAMHNLAVVAAGRSTPAPDYKLATRWFGEAAERGLTDSQYNLAVLFENGMGTPKDLTQAYKWLLIAAKAGDTDAKGRREALKAKLNPDQLADAEAQASGFRAKAIDQAANDARVAGRSWQAMRPAPTRG